jgi:hypothetical protein
MKTYFSKCFGAVSAITILAAISLPMCALSAQSAPLGPAGGYASQDISADVAIGPVINVKQLTSSPSGSSGNVGAEIYANRFPRLRPPVKNNGPVIDRAPATGFSANAAAALLNFRGFTGLTHLDQRLSNGGNQFSTEPPDQGLAVGNGFVMEGVNSAINVYDTNGIQQLLRPLSLTEFFGLPPAIDRTTGKFGIFVGDVSCLFDPETQRWFVVAWTQLNTTKGIPLRQSRLYLAVSQTSDPRGAFSTYVFNTTGAGDVDQAGPRVPDFPHFAVDHYGLYISWNEYGIDTGGNLDGFIGAAIIAVSKDALISGSGGKPPRTVRFALPFASGFEFDIWPAYTPPGSGPVLSNGGTQFFVSSEFVSNNENQMAVWALTNTSSLDTKPALTLSATAVMTQAYHFPSTPLQQKRGFYPLGMSLGEPLEKLDPGDFRVVSAEFVNGRLWATLNSEMVDGNGSHVQTVAYFAFSPSVNGHFITATVATQGIVSETGISLTRPAIAINAKNRGAIVFTLVGPDSYPSAAFAPIDGNAVGPIHIARAGNEPEDGFTGYRAFGGNGVARWGDYSAGAVNNTDNSVWVATEYTPDLARTSLANWATYVIRLLP